MTNDDIDNLHKMTFQQVINWKIENEYDVIEKYKLSDLLLQKTIRTVQFNKDISTQLVIHKENDDKFKLIVFDVNNNAKYIYEIGYFGKYQLRNIGEIFDFVLRRYRDKIENEANTLLRNYIEYHEKKYCNEDGKV